MKLKKKKRKHPSPTIPESFPRYPQLDVDFYEDLETPESYATRAEIFEGIWQWAENNVYRVNRLKGWINRKERRDGELIALIHSELSECLEYLRHGNPKSDHIPEFSGAEEELADVIIRIMDIAKMRNWNVAKAFIAKLEFNKTRPYRHGGKLF